MQFTAVQIAALIGGTIHGNAAATVSSFAKIEEAVAGQLSFLSNPKYEDYLYTTGASLIIVNAQQELKQPVAATLIRVPDAYAAFATLLHKYQQLQHQQLTGIQQPSFIAETARFGENVYVGAFAYIGENVTIAAGTKIFPFAYIGNDVSIGENCTLHPSVVVYHQCQLGNRVTIHSGTIVGGDGFGFAPLADGTYQKIPQIGNVVIENDVEIGANCTIDRATMGSTVIKAGAKLDNLLQIAHNVEVGHNAIIAAQAGISGSTKIGDNVMIGGQAGIVGHLQIADGCKINAQSGVSKSMKVPGSSVTGSPAFDYTAALRSQAAARKLPELEKRVRELEELVKEMLAKTVQV
jgi:UDP-3-O-[3-hydroxymyristoyl] glucosamine N-acyltransferase